MALRIARSFALSTSSACSRTPAGTPAWVATPVATP
jgi:hypothetical protein